jgi:hypothetical protein
MKNWVLFAVGTVLAVGLIAQVRGLAAAEKGSGESPVQRFYVGLVALEKSTNSVVRDVLVTLTGQPAAALRLHSGPPPRCGSRCPAREG